LSPAGLGAASRMAGGGTCAGGRQSADTEINRMASKRRIRSRRPSESSKRPLKRRPLDAIEEWLAAHRSIVFGIVAAAAITTRVVYFMQLNATPLMETQRWAQSDMHYYDAWAKQIATGDWLSRSASIPMHRWHHEVAQLYLASHPDAKASIDQARRAGEDPDQVPWSRG